MSSNSVPGLSVTPTHSVIIVIIVISLRMSSAFAANVWMCYLYIRTYVSSTSIPKVKLQTLFANMILINGYDNSISHCSSNHKLYSHILEDPLLIFLANWWVLYYPCSLFTVIPKDIENLIRIPEFHYEIANQYPLLVVAVVVWVDYQ